MGTPASNVLSGANSTAAVSDSTASGASAPGANSQPAANEGFWKDWNAPEQKETKEWIANKKYADPFVLAKTAQGLEKEAATLRTAVNVKAYPEDKVDPKTGAVTKADANALTAWRTAMGVPATPADYKLEVPANSPYPQFTGYLSEVLHEAGAPPAMAKVLAAGYEKAVQKLETELRAAEDTKSASDLKQLEMEWGSNYQERIALGARGKDWLAKEVGGLNDMQLRTIESVLGTSKFMALMWKFGEGNKEPSFAGGNASGKGFEGGASAAQTEWDQIMADRTAGKISNHVWNNPTEIARRDALVERIAQGNAH
jgi:hypothetical protein